MQIAFGKRWLVVEGSKTAGHRNLRGRMASGSPSTISGGFHVMDAGLVPKTYVDYHSPPSGTQTLAKVREWEAKTHGSLA